jgi:hypothetical protein
MFKAFLTMAEVYLLIGVVVATMATIQSPDIDWQSFTTVFPLIVVLWPLWLVLMAIFA